jgi:hypothetical protein
MRPVMIRHNRTGTDICRHHLPRESREVPYDTEGLFAMAASTDPMIDIADAVSALLADGGVAFVEDDHVEALADTLSAFFKTAGIPIDQALAVAFSHRTTDRTQALNTITGPE